MSATLRQCLRRFRKSPSRESAPVSESGQAGTKIAKSRHREAAESRDEANAGESDTTIGAVGREPKGKQVADTKVAKVQLEEGGVSRNQSAADGSDRDRSYVNKEQQTEPQETSTLVTDENIIRYYDDPGYEDFNNP